MSSAELALYALAAARDDLESLSVEAQKQAVERIISGDQPDDAVRIANEATMAWRRADDAVRMISAGGFDHGERH